MMAAALRGMGTALAASLLGVLVSASPGHAALMLPDDGRILHDGAPETSKPAKRRLTPQQQLARQVARRGQALSDLNLQAARYDQELLGLRETLAVYGYTGDPAAATLVLPIANYRISAGFGLTGPLWVAEHGGQDFSASTGEPLVAVGSGTISEVGEAGPYGLRTVLTLEDGTEVWYCHQTTVSVVPGDVVEVVDVIGTVGSTGKSTGPHLHLEVRPGGGAPIDPVAWFAEAGLNP